MKKYFLSTFLLLMAFAMPALAEATGTTPAPRLTFTIDTVTFAAPSGFICTGNTEDVLSFENDNATIITKLYSANTCSFNKYYERIEEFVTFDHITDRNTYNINGVPVFILDYEDEYMGLQMCGKFIGVVDQNSDTLYAWNYYANRELTEEDQNNVYDLVMSIEAPTLQHNPVATSEPTATPAPVFDFDAINRNPDKYEGQYFGIIGTVVQVVDESEGNSGTIVSAQIATQGSDKDIIYMIYLRQPGEDRILEGDKISFTGCAHGLFSYVNRFKKKITIPEFYGYYVTLLND